MDSAEPVGRAGAPAGADPSVTSINMDRVAWCNAERNGKSDARWCSARRAQDGVQ